MDKKYKLFNAFMGVDNSLRINTLMIERLGVKEAVVAKELLNRYVYYAKKNQLIDGRFEFYYDDLIKKVGMTKKQTTIAVANLERAKVIETEPIIQDRLVIAKKCKFNKDVYDSYLKDGQGNICANIENDDYWINIPTRLLQKYGPITAIIYCDIYNHYIDAKRRNNLIEGLWFRYSHGKIAKKLKVSRQVIITLYIPELVQEDLVWTKTFGLDNATYFCIHEAKLIKVFGLDDYLVGANI